MPDNPGPPLPARWRRLYAHVVSLDLACPACGRITVSWKGKNHAYNRATGIYKCSNEACNRRFFVGVILWPAGMKSARAWDHVPTPGEALQLREMTVSAVTEDRIPLKDKTKHTPDRHRAQVNYACTCGGCPVHDGAGIEVDEDDDN